MNIIYPETIENFADILSGLIALLIALIALNGYLRFKNWRFLFLGTAFLILAVPLLIGIPLLLGILSNESLSVDTVLGLIVYLIYVGAVVAFAMLTSIYLDESRKSEMRISGTQWAIGAILIVAELTFLAYELTYHYFSSDNSSSGFNVYAVIEITALSISFALLVIVIISLISYYKTNKTTGTLLAITGFILLTIGQLYALSRFSRPMNSALFDATKGWGSTVFSIVVLFGFIAFLVATIRTKVFHDR
jgi:hypothetical protein